MDIQAQVAARRREIERERAAAQAKLVAAETANRTGALDKLAASLTASSGADVERQGDRVGFGRPSTLDQVDPAAFRRQELRRMLRREARLEFTQVENLVSIAGLSVGVTLLAMGVADWGGFILAVAMIATLSFIGNHRKRLMEKYPQLFGPDAGIMPPPAPDEDGVG